MIVMKRRNIVLGGATLGGAAGIAWLSGARPGSGEPISTRSFDWTAADFRAGGTAGVAQGLPPPIFRDRPQCIATLARTQGPCHTNDVPVRRDMTEGVAGLPMRLSLRIVDASTCTPIENADVEIWHVNAQGVYSGRAAGMCNAGETAAQAASFLRGRQISDNDGIVSFLSVYPGWYPGRTVHVHMRILLGEAELLITQLLFDDALSDIIFAGHPDYRARPSRDTMNGDDGVFPAGDVAAYIFDVEKLDGGILQASYAIGVENSG
jgi:protocatechuate 3,4-dioxygenase beta subunit